MAHILLSGYRKSYTLMRLIKKILLFIVLSMGIYGTVNAETVAAISNQAVFPPANIPEILGWVPLPSCENICCGYFQEPLAPFLNMPLPPIETTSVVLNANQTLFNQSGPSALEGNVSITQPGRLISSNQAVMNRDTQTKEIKSVDLKGKVVLREPGRLVVAECGHVELHSKAGALLHAVYHFVLGGPEPFVESDLTCASQPFLITPEKLPLNAWGIAGSVEHKETGVIELRDATYTTCAPTSNTWKLAAGRIDLDPNVGRGYAYNTWLTVKGVPVFYTPYFNFPIDHRRKSGFLFPTMGHSSQSGYYFGLPYYWNIAPNYDATITPTLYSLRGMFTDGEFRYLDKWNSGTFTGGFIPHDNAFSSFKEQARQDYAGNPALNRLLDSSNSRGYFSWQDSTVFNQHWNGAIDYNYVSDDYFLEDFNSFSPLVTNQLPRQAILNYNDDLISFNGRVQAYQTLHPVNLAPVSNPYQELPELNLNFHLPNRLPWLRFQENNQFAYFERAANPGEISTPPNAKRINIQPILSTPLEGLSGYFTPTLQFALTHYDIGHQVSGYSSDITRAMPLFNIDSGLFFDRYIRLFHGSYQQTLEPRAYYLYVPYRNQDSIPIFDSSLIPFSYDTMFLTNRFAGLDRIGDANQVTLALTTRLLNEQTGQEKFRASVGEIIYFRNRIVTTCTPPGTPGAASTGVICVDPLNQVGATSPTEKVSPLAGQLFYKLASHWNATADGVWDIHLKKTINANVSLQYLPAPNHIINFGYNFLSSGDPLSATHTANLNQTSFSFAWPIEKRWQAVGGINYDLVHGYPQTYLYGLQYDSCCWAARVVAGRTFVGLSQNNNPIFNNAVYFQWQFKGLGNLGTSDPATFLTSNIPGYQDTFGNAAIFR